MRRILAVTLPDLPLSLALRRSVLPERSNVVVILDLQAAIIAAVSPDLRGRIGPGQTVIEASVRVSALRVVHVGRAEITEELGRIAEILLELAPTAAIRLENVSSHEEIEPHVFDDTVWLDVTGASHLVGGEEALFDVVQNRLVTLGHRIRLAIASGPRIAQALARHAKRAPTRVMGHEAERNALAELSFSALPLAEHSRAFFHRVGVHTVGDAARLPRGQLSHRLAGSPRARAVLDLLNGRDDVPLVSYSPPPEIAEALSFEDGIEGTEPLSFVLRGMTSRLGARLLARGEVIGRLDLTLSLDRSVVRLSQGDDASPRIEIAVALPVSLADGNALLRALLPALERTPWKAPVVEVRLAVGDITRAHHAQLDFARERGSDPERLPQLMAELSSLVGSTHVGFLRVIDAYRPEARSRLETSAASAIPNEQPAPVRLLPTPISIAGPPKVGAKIVIHGRSYVVAQCTSMMRLESIEWWRSPVSRDYSLALLVAMQSRERIDAFVYIDRATGQAFIHGFFE